MLTYFYKDIVIYPLVATESTKTGLKLENQHYTDILTHVQEIEYSQL